MEILRYMCNHVGEIVMLSVSIGFGAFFIGVGVAVATGKIKD